MNAVMLSSVLEILSNLLTVCQPVRRAVGQVETGDACIKKNWPLMLIPSHAFVKDRERRRREQVSPETGPWIFLWSWQHFPAVFGKALSYPTNDDDPLNVMPYHTYLPIFQSFLLHGIHLVKKISGQALRLSYPCPFILMLSSCLVHRHEQSGWQRQAFTSTALYQRKATTWKVTNAGT